MIKLTNINIDTKNQRIKSVAFLLTAEAAAAGGTSAG